MTDDNNSNSNVVVESIQDLICNIKEAMGTYFYPKSEADDTFAASSHNHAMTDVTGLGTALSNKSDTGHTHAMNDVTGLSGALSNKSDTGHDHDARYYTKTTMNEDILPGYSLVGHNHDDEYYTEGEVDLFLLEKSNTNHDHDDRYFTEAEMTTKLALKSDTTHKHTGTYPAMADFNTLKGNYDKTSRVWVRLIRADQNGVPISQDTQVDNEGTTLEVVTNYKLGARLYSSDPTLSLNNREVTLIMLANNGYPTMQKTTTNSQGITNGMINLGNNLDGIGFALLKGTSAYNKSIDIKYVDYQ